jgi:hypothetical protein
MMGPPTMIGGSNFNNSEQKGTKRKPTNMAAQIAAQSNMMNQFFNMNPESSPDKFE